MGYFIKFILLLILPFLILIRGAVYLHVSSDYLPLVCIIGAGLFTILLIFSYLGFIRNLLVVKEDDGPSHLGRRMLIATFLVTLYIVHGVFYLSSSNLKTKELTHEIRQVHPIIRLAVSTLIHLDKELIITDANRTPEDYRKMGLKQASHSLHYKQSTGYAHAMDIRTKGRPEWKNILIETYFRLMGFRTLRHIGTADHLHVSLKSHDRPQAK